MYMGGGLVAPMYLQVLPSRCLAKLRRSEKRVAGEVPGQAELAELFNLLCPRELLRLPCSLLTQSQSPSPPRRSLVSICCSRRYLEMQDREDWRGFSKRQGLSV